MALQERLDQVQNNLEAMMIRYELMEIEMWEPDISNLHFLNSYGLNKKPTKEVILSYLTKLIKLNNINANKNYKELKTWE